MGKVLEKHYGDFNPLLFVEKSGSEESDFEWEGKQLTPSSVILHTL